MSLKELKWFKTEMETTVVTKGYENLRKMMTERWQKIKASKKK